MTKRWILFSSKWVEIFFHEKGIFCFKKTFWNVLKSFFPSLIKNFFPFQVKTNPIKFHLHKHILPHCMPIKMATCLGLGNTNWVTCRCNLWYENNSLRDSFIQWSHDNAWQGLNIKPKVAGREQDSRETERESVWETIHSRKGELALAIKLTIGENIYGRCGRLL